MAGPMQQRVAYRGRFAPTPSGPLHLGSLLTALACYLQAKTRGGEWWVRIDDLDAPRNAPGAAATILHQLEAHALHWDGSPRYQSQQVEQYREALERLRSMNRVYACDCTRLQLRQVGRRGPDDLVYAGTCRNRRLSGEGHALRLQAGNGTLCYEDGRLGHQCRDLGEDIGDFVVYRSDGQYAYQLACAVDEAAMGITEVVRGADLLGSTFRQLRVQHLLGLTSPAYQHLPVLLDTSGLKLSKQNHATSLDSGKASDNLLQGLQLLGQEPDAALRGLPAHAVMTWALQHWQAVKIPGHPHLTLE